MALVMETVNALRTIRSEMNVLPGKPITVIVNLAAASPFTKNVLARHGHYITHLAKAANLRLMEKAAKPEQAATAVVADTEIFVPLEGLIDFDKEAKRLEKEKSALEADAGRLRERLGKPDFRARAPKEEVEKAEARLAEVQVKLERIKSHLSALTLSRAAPPETRQ
jgi:valyl-tRNA synthetase